MDSVIKYRSQDIFDVYMNVLRFFVSFCTFVQLLMFAVLSV